MARDNSPLKGRIIFAVGARRSGTNWLERILTAGPEIAAMPSESYLFHALEPLAERFQHAAPGLPVTGLTFMARESFLDALRELTDAVFEESFRTFARGARYMVERTPW